jgi:hypothetical protein
MKVSRYKNATHDMVGTITTINEFIENVKTGTNRKAVEWLRSQTDEKIYDEWKKKIPGITPSGLFHYRNDDSIVEHSGIVCLDYDDIDVNEYYDKLKKWEHSYVIFKSVSGQGLKVFVIIKDGKKHRQHYRALLKVWPELDSSCVNESRLCFESWDENIYVNEEAKIFDDTVEAEPNIKTGSNENVAEVNSTYRRLMKWMENRQEQFQNGNRNNYIFVFAGAMCRYGVSLEETLQLLIKDYASENFERNEITNTVRSAYKQNKEAFGTQKFDEGIETFSSPETESDSWDWNKVVYSDIDIMKLKVPENRFLLEDYIPYNSCTLIASMPSNGKSVFMRNLSVHCAYHKELYDSAPAEYVGKKLTVKSGRVLMVCTEDTIFDIRDALGKNFEFYNLTENGNINFIFHNGDWKRTLLHTEDFLNRFPTNLVCVDTYGDLTKGNNNQDNVARAAIEPFSLLAVRHQLACVFVTHVVKSSAGRKLSMTDVLGSIGSVAKCRSVLGLSLGENNIRYLSLLKGNFVSRRLLETAKELLIDEESLTFSATGDEILVDEIGNLSADRNEFKIERLKKLAENIFFNQVPISHKTFLERHAGITFKGVATANRDWKSLKDYLIIEESDEGLWRMI